MAIWIPFHLGTISSRIYLLYSLIAKSKTKGDKCGGSDLTKQTYKQKTSIKERSKALRQVGIATLLIFVGLGFIGLSSYMHESAHSLACILQGVPHIQTSYITFCFTLGDTWLIQAFPYIIALMFFLLAFLILFKTSQKLGFFILNVFCVIWLFIIIIGFNQSIQNEIWHNIFLKTVMLYILGGMI